MAKAHTFSKPFRERGVFWLPSGTETAAVPGELIYVPSETLELELAAPLSPPSFDASSNYPLISGRLIDGTPIAAADCFVRHQSLGAGAIGETILVVNQLFLHALQSQPPATITECRLRLTSLDWWVGKQPVTYSMNPASEGLQTGATIAIRIDRHLHFTEVASRLRVCLESSLSMNMQTYVGADVHASNWLSLVPSAPLTIEECHKIVFQSQTLLSQLIGAPVFVDNVKLRTGQAESGNYCDWYFVQRGSRRLGSRDLHPPEMLVPFSTVQHIFGEIWGRWRADFELLSAVVILLFDSKVGQVLTGAVFI